jgi:hypothetical protein
MWFKNEEHAQSFAKLKARAQVTSGKEFLATLYVLGATGKSLNKYVFPGEIHFEELAKDAAPWSSGKKAHVKLAATFFNSMAWPVTVQDVFYSLDRDNLQVALEGLRFRYS